MATLSKAKVLELARQGVGQGAPVPLDTPYWERLVEDAQHDRHALGYLRARVEDKVLDPEPTQPMNEDGPCTGWGCEAILIY